MAVTKSPSAILLLEHPRERAVRVAERRRLALATLRICKAFSASSRDPETASARVSIDATWIVS